MSKWLRSGIAAGLAMLLAAATGPASAQGAPPANTASQAGGHHRFREKFDAANTTHDGRLTLAQAQAGRLPVVVRNFAAIDADHKGYVTLADVRAFRARHTAGAAQPPAAAPAE